MVSKRVVSVGILGLLSSGPLYMGFLDAQPPEKRFPPGRPDQDVSALVEFYTHETTESVKVFRNQIFVHSRLYSEPAHRLAIFDGLGAKKGEMVVRGAVRDFTVAPDGTIIFLAFGPGAEKRDKRLAVMLQFYDASGRHRSTHELNRWLSPRKVASTPSGDLYCLGMGEEMMEAMHELNRPDGEVKQVAGPVLYKISRTGRVLGEECVISMPAARQEAHMLKHYLDTTPFCIDPLGNKYLQLKEGQVTIVSPTGQVRHVDLPAKSAQIQLLLDMIPTVRSGPLLTVAEGQNEASEQAKARNPLAFSLHNPLLRLYTLDPQTMVFDEVYSGKRLKRIVGQLSDGRIVEAGFATSHQDERVRIMATTVSDLKNR